MYKVIVTDRTGVETEAGRFWRLDDAGTCMMDALWDAKPGETVRIEVLRTAHTFDARSLDAEPTAGERRLEELVAALDATLPKTVDDNDVLDHVGRDKERTLPTGGLDCEPTNHGPLT